jgi:hypothetical protein
LCLDSVEVKRALASLLFPVLSLPLLLPAFFEAEASIVPACCRRGGKHHCATPEAARNASGEGIRAIAPVCPLYSKLGLQPSGSKPVLISQSFSEPPPVLEAAAAAAGAQSPRADARDRSWHKRGPPSLFL